MVLVEKAKDIFNDVAAYWRVPASGNQVAYREYMMLSLGWLGMRLATVFGIGFGVGNGFTGMTLHMTNRDLLIMGYICTAINYALAPFNAWLIDNLGSRDGKYRVFIKLAVPSGILSLFALFWPYEKMGYAPMVAALFIIGQIQGYVQGWFATGVSNLVYVISPDSRERVKIMTVSSLVHNFAPSITGFLIPLLSDVVADGDLYNIRTYRMIYPFFIVIGVALSMTAYYGVSERIVVPRSRTESISLPDALREVSKNKLFWIKCSDNWNNFMEDSKNVLLQWIFYYGKVGSMTMYGVMDTLSYNSSMWAMLFSPKLIEIFGKKGFKLVKNITQVFITLGLALTYKKSLALVFIFYFLNRFWETTEVIDRSIESDIRDYQQYISGRRIDGSFGVVDTYVGGAVGAVTGLFIPWVYKRNGFDGTDYSVLNVYDENGNRKPDSILYTLLDKLLMISLAGAVIDILPWFFYDLSEAKQKAVIRIIRLRSAVEDKNAGVLEDALYCEACEGLLAAEKYSAETKREKLKASDKTERRDVRKQNKEIEALNEEIEIASFIHEELNRYKSVFGQAVLSLCEDITKNGSGRFFENAQTFEQTALALPQVHTKEDKTLRADAIRMMRLLKNSEKAVRKHYPDGLKDFSAADFEKLLESSAVTKEEKKNKNAQIRKAEKERKIYGRVMKPYLWAQQQIMLNKAYSDIDVFASDYKAVKERHDAKTEAERQAELKAAEERKAAARAKRQKKD